jgi:hypothetical protein
MGLKSKLAFLPELYIRPKFRKRYLNVVKKADSNL